MLQTQTPSPIPRPSAASTPTSVGTPPASAIESLRAQTQALQDQLSVLVGRAKGLEVQSRYARGADRAAVRAQLAQVRTQIGQVSGDLASAQAQIAFRQMPMAFRSHMGVPPFSPRWIDQDNVTAVVIVFVLAVLMPISLGITRRIWRRAPKERAAPYSDMVSHRLEHLEQSVDAIAIEIERISESQRFLTKVLASGSGALDAGSGKPIDVSGRADPAPTRALGAGPVEPIRLPNRQSVRAPITPH